MADIVSFPSGCEVLKFEAKAPRRTNPHSVDQWAALVPFGEESGRPFHPLENVVDPSLPPEPPAS
jgi:hypothetical protein